MDEFPKNILATAPNGLASNPSYLESTSPRALPREELPPDALKYFRCAAFNRIESSLASCETLGSSKRFS
jgi:hypothetical protein